MELTRTATGTRKGAAIALALTAALVIGSPAQDAQAAGTRKSQSQLLSLTNNARKQHHVRKLNRDHRLSRYAYKHSKTMADKGALFHTSDLAAPLRGRNWSIAGENVGVGYSVDDIQAAFMNSAPHRKNILRKSFDHAAVGVYQDGDQYWVTVIFYG